jgi:hypothetical protein
MSALAGGAAAQLGGEGQWVAGCEDPVAGSHEHRPLAAAGGTMGETDSRQAGSAKHSERLLAAKGGNACRFQMAKGDVMDRDKVRFHFSILLGR